MYILLPTNFYEGSIATQIRKQSVNRMLKILIINYYQEKTHIYEAYIVYPHLAAYNC